MEKEPLIVPIPEERRSAKFYFLEELRTDISIFPENIQSLIRRFINGETHLSAKKQGEFDLAINQWWQEKYGFPFDQKVAREALLLKKYDPEKSRQAHKLQWELLDAARKEDETKIQDIKKRYQAEYPDQLETVEVVFGIRDFLLKQLEFNKSGRGENLPPERRAEVFRDFTEYQFLLTHFLIQNNKDRGFLDLFWKVQETMAKRLGADALRLFNMLKRGQMSQVAVYRILEEIGDNPKLSHPDEDAFNAVDLWESTDKAVQIKGWEEEVPALFTIEEISFPAMQVDQDKYTKRFYDSVEYFKNKNNIFRAKIKEYGDRLGKEFQGYMLAVPYSQIDFVNGEPSPELIQFFKEKLREKETTRAN